MLDIMTQEREFTQETAKIKIAEFLKDQNLKYNISVFGDQIKTHFCELLNYDNTTLSFGAGKGIAEGGYLGSICEAIEHHFTKPETIDNDITLLPSITVYNQSNLLEDRIIQLLYEEDQNNNLACRTYYDLVSGEKIYYPLFATLPDYNDNPSVGDNYRYENISKYSTNSGTAFGLSFNEALIHAVNERIERDAVSLFLIGRFLRQPNNCVLNIMNSKTLPLDIKVLKEKCENELGCRIIIIMITSNINVHTFLAFREDFQCYIKPLYGCGTSLFPNYAISRALTELVQITHLNDDIMEEEDLKSLEKLRNYPTLLKAAAFQLGDDFCNSKLVCYNDLEKHSHIKCLKDYINTLTHELSSHKFRIYYSINYKSQDTGIHIVNIVIPGLEYFNLIANGNMVTPSNRGMRYLNHGCY